MIPVLDYIAKLWYHNIIVHIYSSPNFVMETLVSILICIIHCLLIAEINGIIKELNVPPLRIQIKNSVSDVKSRQSVYRGVVRNHPDLGVDVVFKENNLLKNEWDTTSKINKILSTSLSEYIKRDLQKLKPKIPIEGTGQDDRSEGDTLHSSMDGVYDYLLTEPKIQKQLGAAGLKKFERTEILRLN